MKADIGIKDIAEELDCSVVTAKRWWRRVKVPPTFPGHSHHRWSRPAFEKLIGKVRVVMVRQRNRISKHAKKLAHSGSAR